MSARRTGRVAPERAPRGTGRGRLKGRYWVALWLLGFLGVALMVQWRQSTALSTVRELSRLQRTRGALEVSRSAHLGEIHRSRSRSVLVPLVQQKLGLRLPEDAEITILQDPRTR